MSEITIKPTKNDGFSVDCRYKQKKSTGSKNSVMPYLEPDSYAFSTFDELKDFLAQKLGAASDDTETETANDEAQ